MLKTDALDEVIAIFIRKALDEERENKDTDMKMSHNVNGSDDKNGIYPSAGLRKQA